MRKEDLIKAAHRYKLKNNELNAFILGAEFVLRHLYKIPFSSICQELREYCKEYLYKNN